MDRIKTIAEGNYMKKIALVVALVALVSGFTAYAEEGPTLFELRNDIFAKSKEMRPLLAGAKEDMIFMNSMWDASIATMQQLDAYFNMLGIFETIKKEDVTKKAVSYLSDWLNTINSTNTMNIQSLNAISQRAVDAATKARAINMIAYYNRLNARIGKEVTGLMAIKNLAK